MAQREFPCKTCGARLSFEPGTVDLVCSHCGQAQHIPQSEDEIEELDFASTLAGLTAEAPVMETQAVRCSGCGAETQFPDGKIAGDCAFCGAPIVVQQAAVTRAIKPQGLLPFKITRKQVQESYIKWLNGLWFAPNNLRKRAESEKVHGIYVPYWTYDSSTESFYCGERGDDYYVTETYVLNGKTQTRTVRKTRWTFVSGVVWRNFDDVLVIATNSLPTRLAEALEPWDLPLTTGYSDEFLAGFEAQTYNIDLKQGFSIAQQKMDAVIRQDIRRDIGGDHQRIHSVKTAHRNVTYKHLLLPIWLSSYRYNEKIYRFLVNGRTGEVQGQRPWSWWKITLAVLGGLSVVAGIAYIVAQQQ